MAEATAPESREWVERRCAFAPGVAPPRRTEASTLEPLEPFSSVAQEGTAAERRSGRKPSVRPPPLAKARPGGRRCVAGPFEPFGQRSPGGGGQGAGDGPAVR